MNTLLQFDFKVDKQTNTIHVTREFDANSDLVWEAWTNPEILDQWWAPRPYRTQTKSQDFKAGGYWHYCMISPENEIHWCLADYKVVDPKKSFSGLDAFCDENRNINTDFPRSLWNTGFTPQNTAANGNAVNRTVVNISIKYETLTDLEKIIELGFKEGFTMAMGNLDEVLVELKSK